MTTLEQVVSALGPEVIRAPVTPGGLDAPFERSVIYDALQTPAFEATDLVLMVGVPADSALALRSVRAGAAALLFRHDGPLDDRLVSEAMACGVAVLAVPQSCPWSAIHEIVLSLPSDLRFPATASLAGTELTEELFVLANAVAETVEAPVTIEDNQSRLLAYSARHDGVDEARSATILGHRVPDAFRSEVRRLGIAKRLLTETEPFHVVSQLPQIRSRMIVPIRARNEVLGSVWALADEPFDDARREAFGEAARTIAVSLLRHRLLSDLQRQQQSAMLAVLLAGGEAAVETARRLGFGSSAMRVVAVAGADAEAADRELLDRCWTTLHKTLSLWAGPACVARVDDSLYCVLQSAPDERGLEQAHAIASKVVEGPGAPERELLVIGISGPAASVSALPQAREEADRVIQVLRRTGGGCADVGEVALQIALSRLAEFEAARPSRPAHVLDTVAEYDRAHGTTYLDTLRVYLSAFGDPSVASAALHVHTNTLRYRVRRLSELFGIDLSDEDVRFGLMLQLRLRRGA